MSGCWVVKGGGVSGVWGVQGSRAVRGDSSGFEAQLRLAGGEAEPLPAQPIFWPSGERLPGISVSEHRGNGPKGAGWEFRV